jgi:hypothetical protein
MQSALCCFLEGAMWFWLGKHYASLSISWSCGRRCTQKTRELVQARTGHVIVCNHHTKGSLCAGFLES